MSIYKKGDLVGFNMSSVIGTIQVHEDHASMETSIGTFEYPIPTTLRLLIDCDTLKLHLGGDDNKKEETTFVLHGLKNRPELNLMRVKKRDGNVVELLPPDSQHWSIKDYIFAGQSRLFKVANEKLVAEPVQFTLNLDRVAGVVTSSAAGYMLLVSNETCEFQKADLEMLQQSFSPGDLLHMHLSASGTEALRLLPPTQEES